MVVLGSGALGAGMAPNLEVLFSSRVVQGVGAAMTQGTSMAIITSAFPMNERGRAIGLIMITVGVGNVVGPAVGGLAVDSFGWRAVFLFTVPLVIFGTVAALLVMRGFTETRDSSGYRFDWLGATLSAAVLIVVLLALTTGNKEGWTSAPIVLYLAAGSCMSVIFVWWELKSDNPILDLNLFRKSTFSLGVSAQFLTGSGNPIPSTSPKPDRGNSRMSRERLSTGVCFPALGAPARERRPPFMHAVGLCRETSGLYLGKTVPGGCLIRAMGSCLACAATRGLYLELEPAAACERRREDRTWTLYEAEEINCRGTVSQPCPSIAPIGKGYFQK